MKYNIQKESIVFIPETEADVFDLGLICSIINDFTTGFDRKDITFVSIPIRSMTAKILNDHRKL